MSAFVLWSRLCRRGDSARHSCWKRCRLGMPAFVLWSGLCWCGDSTGHSRCWELGPRLPTSVFTDEIRLHDAGFASVARFPPVANSVSAAWVATLLVYVPHLRVGDAVVDEDIAAPIPATIATVIPTAVPLAPVEMVVMPVKIITQPGAHDVGRAKVHGRIIDRGRLNIDYLGVIPRLKNIVRLGGNNANAGIVGDHILLRGVHEVAKGFRLSAQCLNRVHDILRLIGESIADLGGPAQVVVQPFQGVRIAGERLDTGVPGIVVHRVGIASGDDKAISKHNVRRNGGCGQNQRDERVRVKGNGPKQLTEFLH